MLTRFNRGCGKILSSEVEIEQEEGAANELFEIHAVPVFPAPVVFARHISCGRSIISVPGQDRNVIQTFVRFLHSNSIESNVSDACLMFEGCGTLNFKLHDKLTTPSHSFNHG